MEKNMKDLFSVIQENKHLLEVRKTLVGILKPLVEDFSVQIGGSYALKYWSEAFADREISDYDFIVKVSPTEVNKVNKHFGWLCKLGIAKRPTNYYDYPSYYMGYALGKKINVIVVPSNLLAYDIYESVQDIINVKKSWVRRAQQSGKLPRAKDLKDIEIYEKWVKDIDLPF